MKILKMQVTIVGAGHYGRNLIGPKYIKNQYAQLKAVVSPTVEEKTISHSALAHVPLHRTLNEWEGKHGQATDMDMFDLCVHAPKIPSVVEKLVKIGARNFIFPKPVALTRDNLDLLLNTQKKYDLKIAVASQWHYAEITKQLKSSIENLRKKKGIRKVEINFSDFQSDEKLKNYTLTSVFLPHLLQILYSTGLCNLNDTIKMRIENPQAFSIVVHYDSTSSSPEATLVSDLKSEKQERTVNVFSDNGVEPKIVANYLNIVRDGKILRFPAIEFEQNKIEMVEDDLESMLKKILLAFINKTIVFNNLEIMTLERYLPIAEAQIRIEEELSARGILMKG